jgi:calcineurin-like phosphoesterase
VIAGTGRTGSSLSVGGLDPEVEIRKFRTQIHEPSQVAWRVPELQGVIVDAEPSGKATGIRILRAACEELQPARGAEQPED